MNVFTWDYSKKYYLTHPWKWARQLFLNIKYAYQRITKGYCATDCYDVDYWLLHTLPSMLRDVATDSIGSYPGVEPFETPEKWTNWLNTMALRLEELQEDWSMTKNEYEKDYDKIDVFARLIRKENEDGTITIHFPDNPEFDEIQTKWSKRAKELREQQHAAQVATLTEIAEHLEAIWT